MVDVSRLMTEQRNPATMNLDQMTPIQIVEVMNREDGTVIKAVHDVLPQVAQAIEWTTNSLQRGGRIIYVGAGTSGRLGVLDASECPPTFGVSKDVVLGLIAGGDEALRSAREGAEDDSSLGADDLAAVNVSIYDTVIGLAASGRTPYVVGALDFARKTGCKTVAIACVRNSRIGAHADLAIEPLVGPEVLTGSTRLKCGTAQKLVLNMISTATMVGMGKVYQNLMVDVQRTNEKLISRARNIVVQACGCSFERADEAINQAGGDVKLAVLMLLIGARVDVARKLLKESRGHIRDAVGKSKEGE